MKNIKGWRSKWTKRICRKNNSWRSSICCPSSSRNCSHCKKYGWK